jgi:hypothetical protein
MNSAPKPHVGPLPTITIDDVISLDPCQDGTDYRNRNVLLELSGGRECFDALDLLAADHIPAEDRLWLALRPELVHEHILHRAACAYASRALARERRAGHKVDARSYAAIRAKLAWLRGKISNNDLRAACEAAWRAARGAAWLAAREAARVAAWGAAWRAACEAARVAAWEAAWGAERKRQIEILQKMLRAAEVANENL